MHLTFDWSTTLRRVRQRGDAASTWRAQDVGCDGWRRFPFGDRIYRYAGEALRANWARLHASDAEPFPDVAGLRLVLDANPALAAWSPDLPAAARGLQEAWQACHAGDFADAVERGRAIGPLGMTVAARAAIVYATRLEENPGRRAAILRDTVEACGELVELAPAWAGAWYAHGLAVGRYCQHVPLVRTIAQGLARRSRESLLKALALQPRHADAHVGLGIHGAEIIDRVGMMVAALTYGVKREMVVGHFEAAQALAPRSPTVMAEYARALMLLGGVAAPGQAHGMYAEAAGVQPVDAQSRLDVEWARAELA